MGGLPHPEELCVCNSPWGRGAWVSMWVTGRLPWCYCSILHSQGQSWKIGGLRERPEQTLHLFESLVRDLEEILTYRDGDRRRESRAITQQSCGHWSQLLGRDRKNLSLGVSPGNDSQRKHFGKCLWFDSGKKAMPGVNKLLWMLSAVSLSWKQPASPIPIDTCVVWVR